MKIFLATDHAGFDLKENIKGYLLSKGYQVEDCGAFEFVSGDDYPDLIKNAALQVSRDIHSLGIIFGRSGAGEAIVANKIIGIRAITGYNDENVKLAREHNDANVLSLGSDFMNLNKARELVDLFLNTSFSDEARHVRRIEKIAKIERES
jgi:ribose 5-phosphate isomerase B